MKHRTSILFGLICLLAISGVSASSQVRVESFNSISRHEVELLIADISKTNPAILKKFADAPEMKRQQLENLRQLLAFASQAVKDGLTADPTNRQELDSIRAETVAVNYDKEVNKGKAARPAFGFITDAAVNAYWASKEIAGQRTHEAEFNDFLNAKIVLLKASSPDMKDRELSQDEKDQARDVFARTRIYEAEYELKLRNGTLTKEFIDKTDLQVKLQQAQFLARLYSENVAEQTKASDEEVAAYFAAHPDVNPARKRAFAQGILDRAKAGENFAALANKFSQDPGNIGPNGVPVGGLYKDVPVGKMLAPFEAAALALQIGQVGPELVETDHGYHIIKLERKLGKKKISDEATYDVRHILISTNVEDPEDPSANGTPAKDFARNELETAKEKALIAKLVVKNNIQVPDDFTVPATATGPVKKPQD